MGLNDFAREEELARREEVGNAIGEFPADKRQWAVLCRRTNDPKLMWIEAQLEAHEIEYRRNGYSWHAPILEVPALDFLSGLLILESPVGQLELGGTSAITIDDIPDEHPFFMEWAMATGRAFAPREARETLRPLDVTDSTFAGLSYEDIEIPEVGPVRMVDVDSRMLSAIGKFDAYSDWKKSERSDVAGIEHNYLFARFKGSADLYRYEGTTLAQFLELLRRQRSGESLGTYFDATFKKHPDLYPYERWNEEEGRWIRIDPTKKKRGKLKDKGQQVAVVLPKEQTEVAQEIVEHVSAPVEEVTEDDDPF